NGAGKTTTMQMLTGFLPPTSGTASVAGFDVFKQSIEVRRRIGYLPEQPPLYEDMSVLGYLEFAGKLKQLAGKARRAAVDRVMEQTGIVDRRGQVIRTLSKGFKQRVGLAQALLGDPEVLILDEPTVGLDPVQIREIRELIKSFEGSHTVILSTHILPEVQMTCSRIVIIHRGRIVSSDDLRQLNAHERTEESVRLRLADPNADATEALGAVSGVRDLIREGGGAYLLRVDPAKDARPGIADAVARGGWGLVELTGVERTLEDIFIQATSGDL
ncbi:MAG: ATP-binding cassette domain-containing protein, partial [Myxococcales bacterium]|nr:ATP-binding cassette domain-containing protein [Myxococcales bacterium]